MSGCQKGINLGGLGAIGWVKNTNEREIVRYNRWMRTRERASRVGTSEG